MAARSGPAARPFLLLAAAAAMLGASAPANAVRGDDGGPVAIARQGSFSAGGTRIGPEGKSSTCDHGYVEFQIPVKPRKYGLFLWHSSSTSVWQNRWDGGEGFQTIFLRKGFPTYLWDGPRVGRANLPCEGVTTTPREGQDEINFRAWRFGPSWGQWFPGVQFPKDDPQAFDQAMRARYEEFDTMENARLQAHAAAAALERTGPAVLVTNSAGGLRALLTALESDNVAGIVAYENVGYILPEEEDTGKPAGPFGPIYVPLEQFKKLARVPMQFVWGDNLGDPKTVRGPSAAVPVSRRFVELIRQYGGKAEVLMLPEAGLKGNTHIPFADLNNRAVADLMMDFLTRHGLDARADSKPAKRNN